MKINFELPSDGRMHRYCLKCQAEGAEQVKRNGKTVYFCPTCQHTDPRAIYFKEHKAWLDQNKELWHESAGVFVRNKAGKFLFFQRTEYPFSLTVPAGHVDVGEQPELSARRELEEEVGIKISKLEHIATDDVWGDSCSAAADVHKWHAFMARLKDDVTVKVEDEGEKPVWLTLDEAEKADLAFVINHFVTRYKGMMTV